MDISSTLTANSEEKQWLRERRMADELRQRELDREAAKEEKQRDREDRMQSNLLLHFFFYKKPTLKAEAQVS